MRYTQSQIRNLLSISLDAFRAWRKVIPALSLHKGHAPSFTPGDVVALAIIAELVGDFGLRVGVAADRLEKLFGECRGKSWVSLENSIILIGTDDIFLIEGDVLSRKMIGSTMICMPCAPIIMRLRSALAATELEDAQGHLQFTPTLLTTRSDRRGRRA
jgi:hypothetical protein